MKEFKVNADSWHYKFNLWSVPESISRGQSYRAERYLKSKDNFCSYWNYTLLNTFKVALATSLILLFAGAVLYLLYLLVSGFLAMNTEIIYGTLMGIAFIAFMIIVVYVAHALDERKKAKINKIMSQGETETSLAKGKWYSWKNKVCLPVTFEDKTVSNK